MIWGCMTTRGVLFAKHIEGRMNDNQDIQIPDLCFPLTLIKFGSKEENAIFQRDKNPKHIPKISRE